MKNRPFLTKRKFLKISLMSIFIIPVINVSKALGRRFFENVMLKAPISPNNIEENRRVFAFKKRRIIVNNDGNDMLIKKESDKDNPFIFIKRRFTGLKNTQVDAVSYCTGVFNLYTHKSKVSEAKLYNTEGREFLTKYLFDKDSDSLTEAIKFCRSNNLDIFWSFRFNDTHDSQIDRELSTWKSDHKKALMGKPGEELGLGSKAWSALNYSKKEVREQSLNIIKDVVTRYDIDGIEIDFYRHMYIFKEVQDGKVPRNKNKRKFTEFIGHIRTVLNEESIKKQKPLLLLIRIPDSISYCQNLGLDLKTWFELNYIDVIIGGGYFKLEPWGNLVQIGKQFDLPVYACLTPRRIHGGGSPGQKSDLPKWRGEAYNALKAGVNGVYTFNRFNSRDAIFREIGEVDILENLDRVDQESYVCESCWFKPQRWLKDGEKYINYSTK